MSMPRTSQECWETATIRISANEGYSPTRTRRPCPPTCQHTAICSQPSIATPARDTASHRETVDGNV